MKKIFMAAIIAMSAVAANAQVWVGGKIALDIEDEKATDKTNTVFQFSPEVGYKLSENVDVAVALAFASVKKGDADATTAFGVNPYVRYSFAKCGNVSFFVDGGVEYATWSTGGSTWGIGVRPGVAFAVSEKVGLVGHLGYIGYQKDSKSLGDNSRFGVGVDNTNLTVGVYYNF